VSPLVLAEYPVIRSLQTRWSDNDSNGHLNNAVYYELFDTLINDWVAEQPPPGGTAAGRGPEPVPVVAESHCRFRAELSYPGAVTGALRVGRLGRTSIAYELALFRPGPDGAAERATLAATCDWVHVYIDRATRRPVPLPPRVRDAARALTSRAGG
jgi:acyl-CoA thioester hydrolase